MQYRDADWLRQKYHKEQLSIAKIADICGVVESTIYRWMERNDIDRRSNSEATKLQSHSKETRQKISEANLGDDKPKYTDEDWLREKYLDEDLHQYEIAEICNVEDVTISNWIRKFGIETDDYANKKYRNKEWLQKQYHGKNRTCSDIAEECGVAPTVISDWRIKHGIDPKPHSEALTGRSLPSGKDSPFWRGGKESFYGSNWYRKKHEALDRADHSCENPDCDEDVNSLGMEPDVHHIIPQKVFDEPEASNTLDNLVAFCRKCHKKAEPAPITYNC